MYFDKHNSFTKERRIKFNLLDKFPELLFLRCCFKRNKHHEKLFEKGRNRVMHDLNLFAVVQKLYKMQALIIQMSEKIEDPHFVHGVKEKYASMVTVHTDSEKEDQIVS